MELGGKGAEAFAGIELVAADGTKLKGGTSNLSAMGQVSYARDAKLAEMKGAQLKLNFREGGKLVVIPFNLPEVKVAN